MWTIPTQPFKGAHFATFPERLAEIPIRAGCPQCLCKRCGRARIKVFAPRYYWQTAGRTLGPKQRTHVTATLPGHATKRVTEAGWKQCDCGAGFEAGLVLDPFFGTGTTGLVARRLGRHFLGIELNPEYVRLARERVTGGTRAAKL